MLFAVSSVSSAPSFASRKVNRGIQVESQTRIRMWLALFVFVFFLFPIGVLIVFRVFPAFMSYLDMREDFAVGAHV
ncbi:hypothetical protein Y032_0047g1454 [Ancylostoma ceylanicum]|uniref:Uncharacterized protein n=1 Tax=Ancylostoma ceylanicum TaxID=53326 RepID=A0A016UAP3_9BILA|nr:hypothetical protein Y032_0047g1454 [Ancylostoma ceylanicum]